MQCIFFTQCLNHSLGEIITQAAEKVLIYTNRNSNQLIDDMFAFVWLHTFKFHLRAQDHRMKSVKHLSRSAVCLPTLRQDYMYHHLSQKMPISPVLKTSREISSSCILHKIPFNTPQNQSCLFFFFFFNSDILLIHMQSMVDSSSVVLLPCLQFPISYSCV